MTDQQLRILLSKIGTGIKKQDWTNIWLFCIFLTLIFK